MKFTVLYENTEERRNHVLNFLKHLIDQKVDLTQTPIDHPVCSVRPSWPNPKDLLNLPLIIQCEELELKEGNFVSCRRLVIDVSVEVTPVPEEKKE